MNKVVSKPSPAEGQSMAAQQALSVVKKQLRSRMRTQLTSIPKSALEMQSNKAFQALLNLESYKEARRISVYLSMPSGEIQTDQIVRHALSNGKEVFIPYLYKEGEMSPSGPKRLMDMVRLSDIKDYESLERDSWGIPTVTEQSVEGRQRILDDATGGKSGSNGSLDLILMPGVAFEKDRKKIRRLGHGKGFYDYFLHRYQSHINPHHLALSSTHPTLYGLALEEQFLQDSGFKVPVGPLDSLLDGLIVGDGQTICVAPGKWQLL